jgi:hypothetical protein
MKELNNEHLTGERVLFQEHGLKILDSTFDNGESPLKHSKYIELEKCRLNSMYPFWYSEVVKIRDSEIGENGGAAFWYCSEINVDDSTIMASKWFRRSHGISLKNVVFTDCDETMWKCQNVRLKNVKVKGEYFGMDCDGMEIKGLELDGSYAFDSARNITIRDSVITSQDAFWNCENVDIYDSKISSQCLGWNSRNVTFVNCTIESNQGMCFVKNLTLKKCSLPNTDLAFEYSNVNAEIVGNIASIKNPNGGIIMADSIGEIILESDNVDISRTKIICGK